MRRRSSRSRGGGRLEQLDEVPCGVDGENLCAAGTGHDLVAEPNPLPGEAGDLAVEVVDDEVDAVPSTGAGSFAIRHRSAGRALRAGQQEPHVASSDIPERRTRDADCEAEVAGAGGAAPRRAVPPTGARLRGPRTDRGAFSPRRWCGCPARGTPRR